MNITNQGFIPVPQGKHNDTDNDWQAQLQAILRTQDLSGQQREIQQIAAQLNVTVLDCAAALLYLNKGKPVPCLPAQQKPKNEQQNNITPLHLTPAIKLVRYRLDLGNQHKLSLTQLKKVIVEESGVDINNIFNVRIQDSFTLVDLPDEMPQEIFHHLKTVEINGQKLDIRRVKARNKNYGRKRRHNRANTGGSVSSKAIT